LGRALGWPILEAQSILQHTPAPVLIGLCCLIAWQAGGGKVCALMLATCAYSWLVGFWVQSLNTLCLVSFSILLASVAGFTAGVAAHRNPLVKAILDPVLDLMQCVPTFAYLIPALLLFGFGPIVAVIASAIFAAPPMARNTALGLERVPADIRAAGVMSGCSPLQQFWWVEVPAALPQLKLGLNQTTMAAFSMIIIAAIIGGFNDLGWEVLSDIRQADFGQSVLSALVIVLLALSLDRITLGIASRRSTRHSRSTLRRFTPALLIVLLGLGLHRALARFDLEGSSAFVPVAHGIDEALLHVTAQGGDALASLKTHLLYFIVLPIKLGLRSVTPMTWGIAVTPTLAAAFWILISLAAVALGRGRSIAAGATVLLAGAFLYAGVTGMPWLAWVMVVTTGAYLAGGPWLALFAALSLAFIAVSGQWQQSVISVYLCATAILLSIALGMSVGLWAASSDRVSRIARPITDALQTTPQFVFLIPALMFFGVGDFTGLIAIALYAVVPAIRYTEFGLRQVPREEIEAGMAMGCTPGQILRLIRLPRAVPQILLGLNQTILFALAMLVVASLVGTDGLGQQIYIGLSQNDPGSGMVAGLSLALIAMMTDRTLKAAAARRQAG
jgi:glycine betaine/proline transport system permease protein